MTFCDSRKAPGYSGAEISFEALSQEQRVGFFALLFIGRFNTIELLTTNGENDTPGIDTNNAPCWLVIELYHFQTGLNHSFEIYSKPI